MDESIAEPASYTKPPSVDRISRVPPGTHHFVSPYTEIESTTHTAVSTDRFNFTGWIGDFLGYQGFYRTTYNAFPARDADRLLKGFVAKGADFEVISAIGHINRIHPYNFPACSNAYTALDALVGIKVKKRITGIYRKLLGYAVQTIQPALVKTDPIDQLLEATCAILSA